MPHAFQVTGPVALVFFEGTGCKGVMGGGDRGVFGVSGPLDLAASRTDLGARGETTLSSCLIIFGEGGPWELVWADHMSCLRAGTGDAGSPNRGELGVVGLDKL